MLRVLSIIGTRPEAIKMAPVIKELEGNTHNIISRVCVTAQHREMLDQVLELFHIAPHYDLDIMQRSQTPTQVASNVLHRLEPIIQNFKPDWVLIQGDTTTVMAASIAAFYSRVKVAHVEAGLRTYDKWQPFPEEINRRLASIISDIHFTPTIPAKDNLLQEGIPASKIIVSGNPIIDALIWVTSRDNILVTEDNKLYNNKKLILVTAHRRENFGEPIKNICLGLKDIATRNKEKVHIVYPVHPNPNIREPVYNLLNNINNITLLEPLNYASMVNMIKRAYIVLTDSGGIQEEAPGLGKPVLVLREKTERPEGIAAGTARLIGTSREKILEETEELLNNQGKYYRMANAANPYGDGYAAKRIVGTLLGEKVVQFCPSNHFSFKENS